MVEREQDVSELFPNRVLRLSIRYSVHTTVAEVTMCWSIRGLFPLLAGAGAAVLLGGCNTTDPIPRPPPNVLVHAGGAGSAAVIGDNLPVGAIMPYAGEVNASTRAALAANGWLVCDGAILERDAYPELFRVLGAIHGHGDGVRTFTLPDYRGRFLRGVSGGSARDEDALERAAAAAGGHSGNNVGSIQEDAIGLHEHTEVGVAALDSRNVVIASVSPEPGMLETHPAAVAGSERDETRPENANVHNLVFAGVPEDAAAE
jgi:microcystin-dependent protein